MVAQVRREMFSPASLTPSPDPSDSADVLTALATARDCEARGEIREAVQFLRRAADAAEQQGNDARVLVLARAAADLTNRMGPSLTVTNRAAPPRPAAPPPRPAAPLVDMRVAERSMRVGSIRVAFEGSMQDGALVVHRLAYGQPVPEGMTEAMLVVTGGVEGRVEIETTLRVVDRS
jgi:hypothetical protein